MTAPTLDHHGERAARELAKGLDFVPRSILADPYALALRFMQWLADDHWRRIPPPPSVITATRTGAPPEAHADELDAARKACAVASDKHRKDHP